MTVKAQQETLNFQTEVADLLHLVTHSLYSNKEIFLRELISNASDAADKLRFEALSDNALYEKDSTLGIWVSFDKDKKTITVRDNGVGMSREDIIENLGTIAKSGTREFVKKLTGAQAKDSQLIGQFGVGFYSAYVVADKVAVTSRRAGMKKDQGAKWASDGKGTFSIENVECEKRGTEIVLHLKKDCEEFLDDMRLRTIVRKYSDHILLPVHMKKIEEESKDEWEVVNKATALWTLPKNKIKDEEYQELYKHISHDFEDALTWAHNKVEGKLEYTTLLYIPKHPPFDLFSRDSKRGLKLYVQRVFIMDDAEQLLPSYLRFVRGVVDSNDLPLNVSREILQNNKIIEIIRSGCVRRVLDLLEKLAKDDVDQFQTVWKHFGAVLKEGVVEDFANKDRIAGLLRFSSTQNEDGAPTVSLKDYISRMKKGQEHIYYVTSESYDAAKNSPHLEIFRKKGIEVLLLCDRVDEWMTGHLTEFEGKTLQSVAKGEIDLSDVGENDKKEKKDEKKEKAIKDEFESTIKQMKDVLGEKVEDVRVTNRLTDSPACLVGNAQDISIHLQRILSEAGQAVPMAKPIFEVNPEHVLLQKIKSEQDDQRFAQWTELLFDQAFLAEGGQLTDPASFVKRVNQFLSDS